MRQTIITVLTTAACAFSTFALAQDTYPARPVKMIVPYPPGGATDILARAVAEAFQRSVGKAMVVENRPGAAGTIGSTACKNAPPDGYTYCLFVSDALAINPNIYKTLPYDPDKDFAVVATLGTLALVFATNSSVPANNLKEFAAWSQANKAKANFASWGVGSAAHLTAAQFNDSMKASVTHVPYQGIPQMIQATITGDVAATLLFYGPMEQHIKAGKLKPLAVMTDKRFPALPDVPTAAEAGFNFKPTLHYGVFTPVGTPAPVLARMQQLVTAAAADPAVLNTMKVAGFIPLVESPQAFSERMARDRKDWGAITKSLNLALE